MAEGGLEGVMGFGFIFLFFSTLSLAQNNGSWRVVTLPGLSDLKPQPILRYQRAQELRDQVRLFGVHLEYKGEIFHPAVHIAAYMDEVSGSAICRAFGFGSGVLGAASIDSGFIFSMTGDGIVSDIHTATEEGAVGAATSEVICDRN